MAGRAYAGSMSTVLITGATSGLGRYVAFELVRSGHAVLAHGRDPGRTAALAEELRAEGDAEGFVADLASLAQVRELGARVAEARPGLDVLINNAGVGAGAPGSGRELSADGHELRLAVNYLAAIPSRGCWPLVPVTDPDMRYLYATFGKLNAMVGRAARKGGAELVDTYKATLGHDLCKGPTVRYAEVFGLSLNDPAVGVPAHPNAAGARAQAAAVLAKIRSHS